MTRGCSGAAPLCRAPAEPRWLRGGRAAAVEADDLTVGERAARCVCWHTARPGARRAAPLVRSFKPKRAGRSRRFVPTGGRPLNAVTASPVPVVQGAVLFYTAQNKRDFLLLAV